MRKDKIKKFVKEGDYPTLRILDQIAVNTQTYEMFLWLGKKILKTFNLIKE